MPSEVNDVHSYLNRTLVERIEKPATLADLVAAIERARAEQRAISVAGGRHAMGGQQFGSGTSLIDTTALNRILALDVTAGTVTIESGICWPALIDGLLTLQAGQERPWSIIQKQTGADRLSLGGSLAANVHGRGLRLRPMVADIESFVLVDAQGCVRTCNRRENQELFHLAIGGYGLFGIVYSLTLRLMRRIGVQRRVEIRSVEGLSDAFHRRIEEGFEYGDFQFATDAASDAFLRRGVFSCYLPVSDAAPVAAEQKALTADDWKQLIVLSHRDKGAAFDRYASHYVSTDGQVYWSDTHQLAEYIDDYHALLDRDTGHSHRSSEMITEIYVPRERLEAFLDRARPVLREHGAEVIYGTIRLIEPDGETVLAWATQPWACVIFNLCTPHTPEGLERTAAAFRALIDLGRDEGGSYYLTYHRWATREQVEACHPAFRRFLDLKSAYDPEERLQSDWYRHYVKMFRGREPGVRSQPGAGSQGPKDRGR